MHAQGDIELSARKLTGQFAVGVPAVGFVEGDKLHVRYVAHQPGLGATDNPGDAGVGPVILKIAYYRERVTGVADRGKPKDADVFGRRVGERVRQVDNKGRKR